MSSTSLDDESVRELDEVAFRAWPAERVERVGPWRARLTRGVTRRANSVLPRPSSDRLDPADEVSDSEWTARIRAVEQLYRAQGLVPRFQIAPGSLPHDLDRRLEARSYVVESPVSIRCAALGSLDRTLSQASPTALRAACGAMTEPWFDAAARRGRFHAHPEVFAGILERLGDRAGYAEATWDGEIVATGLAVHDGPWVGIFAMRTVETHRRRGAGRALMKAMGRWASARGAVDAYLQVERENVGALSLYAAAGFSEVYGYHYRMAA